MRTIKTTAGTPIDARRRRARRPRSRLARSAGAAASWTTASRTSTARFAHLCRQMSEDELRAYLKESLFMSFNRFENDRMAAILRKAAREKDKGHE